MSFIGKNDGRFGNIMLNINIDGAGYHEGKTAISFYGVPEDICGIVTKIIQSDGNAAQGPQWPQGDHSIFVQYGVPAIAVSSMWFTENMDNQDITHTEKDNLGIVDLEKTVDAAQLIAEIINRIDYI